MSSLTRLARRARNAVLDWYQRRTDAFKAAWVTAWIAFVARVSVPILALADDVAVWIDGGDPITRAQLITSGRAVGGAVFGLVAFGINYVLRTYRPNAVYLRGAGTSIRRERYPHSLSESV